MKKKVASNLFGDLPQDLITEILLRVPVKSLLRFRCVSKSWLSHISSHEFALTYQRFSTSTRQKLIGGSWLASLYTYSIRSAFDDYTSSEHAPLSFALYEAFNRIQIVGSCNGLVCLLSINTGEIVVWNPATRKYRQLPFVLRSFIVNCYAFGYDVSSDDYIVVHVAHARHRSCYRTYSLRNHLWKPFSDWSHGTVCVSSGVCVNGAIHWIVRRDGSGTGREVVAQNLATETCTSVDLPVYPVGIRIMPVFLGVSSEHLFACLDDGFSMDVWVMEEYGVKESWNKVAVIPLLYNYKLKFGGLFYVDNFVLDEVDSKVMSRIGFQYWEIFAKLRCPRDARPCTYAESLVNPSTFGGLS